MFSAALHGPYRIVSGFELPGEPHDTANTYIIVDPDDLHVNISTSCLSFRVQQRSVLRSISYCSDKWTAQEDSRMVINS